jgi:hypothetical protein
MEVNGPDEIGATPTAAITRERSMMTCGATKMDGPIHEASKTSNTPAWTTKTPPWKETLFLSTNLTYI